MLACSTLRIYTERDRLASPVQPQAGPAPSLGNFPGDLFQQIIGRPAIRLRFEVQNNAVTQSRQHKRADVFQTDVETSIQQRADFPPRINVCAPRGELP